MLPQAAKAAVAVKEEEDDEAQVDEDTDAVVEVRMVVGISNWIVNNLNNLNNESSNVMAKLLVS